LQYFQLPVILDGEKKISIHFRNSKFKRSFHLGLGTGQHDLPDIRIPFWSHRKKHFSIFFICTA